MDSLSPRSIWRRKVEHKTWDLTFSIDNLIRNSYTNHLLLDWKTCRSMFPWRTNGTTLSGNSYLSPTGCTYKMTGDQQDILPYPPDFRISWIVCGLGWRLEWRLASSFLLVHGSRPDANQKPMKTGMIDLRRSFFASFLSSGDLLFEWSSRLFFYKWPCQTNCSKWGSWKNTFEPTLNNRCRVYLQEEFDKCLRF